MRMNFLTLMLIIVISTLSCSQKLPIPASEDTGVLIIPTKITNNTDFEFAYYFSCLYSRVKFSPEKQKVQIEVFPNKGEDFIIVNDFPQGEYQIYATKIMNAPILNLDLFTDTISSISRLYSPIPFKIRARHITLLTYSLKIDQNWVDKNRTGTDIEEDMQTEFNIIPLANSQLLKLIDDIQTLPNVDLYKLAINDNL